MKQKTKKNMIGIISMQSEGAGELNERVPRLIEEIEKRGYKSKVFFFNKFMLQFNEGKIILYYNEKKLDLSPFLFMIPIMHVRQDLETKTMFIRAIEESGVKCVNSIRAIINTKNKAESLFRLSRAGLPIIPSVLPFGETGLMPIFKMVRNKDEFIGKLNKGTQGRGVAYINSKMSLISIIELLHATGLPPYNLVFQKYIKESAGRDLRIIVIGTKIVASMQREATSEDFRANLFSGGTGKSVKLSEKTKKIAIKAIQVSGLDYGGVDIIKSKNGPLIVEINDNPGIGIEEVTNVNVTGAVIDYGLAYVKKQKNGKR